MSRLLELVRLTRSGAPMGNDVEADARFEALEEMFDNPHLRDWKKSLELSQALTKDVGVDLRVLSYGGVAALRQDGWAGLADGLAAWNHVLANHWEEVHPTRIARRIGPARRYVDTLQRWLVNPPGTDDDALPPIVDHAVMQACRQGMEALYEHFGTHFGPKVPTPGDLVARLKAWEEDVQPAEAPPPPPPPPPAPPPAAPTAPAPAPAAAPPAPPPPAPAPTPPPPAPAAATPRPAPPAPAAPSAAPPPEGALDEAALRKGFGQLRTAANDWVEALRAADPGRPEAYRLARDLAWATLPAPATPVLPTPRLPDLRALQALADQPAALLAAAEAAWRTHLLWLDPHRLVAEALGRLGHDAARQAVEHCVHTFVSRNPTVVTVSYRSDQVVQRPDGTVGPADPVPTVSGATKRWLEDLGSSGSSDAPRASSEASGALDLTEVDPLIDAGKVSDVMAWLRAHVATRPSPREKARLINAVAGRLIDGGKPAAALPMLRALDDQLRRHDVDTWEPDLAGEILGNMHAAAIVDAAALGDTGIEAVRQRLARVGNFVPLADQPRHPPAKKPGV